MSITIYSSLPYRSFAARLKREIFNSFRLKWYTIAFSWKKAVAGEVWTWPDNTIKFFIFKRRFIFNFLAPRLEGTIYSAEVGSTIIAKFSVRHVVWEILFPPISVISIITFLLYKNNQMYILEQLLRQNWFYPLLISGIILLIIDGIVERRYLKKYISDFVDESIN